MHPAKIVIANAELLSLRLRADGMIADNLRWIQRGSEPAYMESAFEHLADKADAIAQRLQAEIDKQTQDALGVIQSEVQTCCGTTMDKAAVMKLIQELNDEQSST